MNRPTVVVVTPVYNGATFIDETISSVLSQRGDFFLRYHIQDGGSNDGTIEILREWEERLRNGNPLGGAEVEFSWRTERDAGMYDGIAIGFEHAYADLETIVQENTIMTWINADDLFAVNALRTVCSFFAQHPEVNWITGAGALMNEWGAAIQVFDGPPGFSQRDVAAGFHDGRTRPSFVQQEGTFWRRSIWQRCGGISRSLKLVGDWDLWRRFAWISPPVKIHTVLGLHRRREGQLSGDMKRYYAELDSMLPGSSYPAGLLEDALKAQYELVSHQWQILKVPTGQPVEAPTSTKIKEPRAINCSTDLIGQIHRQSLRLQELVKPCNTEPSKHTGVKEARLTLPATLPGGRPWPKISVVTPSYNQGRYIAETIESVIQQGYPFVEHIIIDGGSTDETMVVVERYRSHLAYVVSEHDNGQSDALNKGFRRATGDILCWLNSDDQFAPGALAAVAMAFATSDADMISGICEVYENGRLVQRHMSACNDGPLPLADLLDLDNGWNAGQFFYQPEVFFSKSLWERAGAHVREDCYYSMDYELWCRFAAAGARLHVIGASLARFRMHPEQKTADPAKFKAELVGVRDRFAATRSIPVPRSVRPPVRWDRTLRVAMVNDIGARYGAGIAQERMAKAIDMAGHTVEIFDLASRIDPIRKTDNTRLIDDVVQFAPDVVIFGNLHAATRDSVGVVTVLGERFPTFWVTHDFWLFTGRCAYPGTCQKYLSGCDASCPTPKEYPDLAPEKISEAWRRKRKMLEGPHAPIILGNSTWSEQLARDALAAGGITGGAKVAGVKLGAPTHVFKPFDRAEARSTLGIHPEHFVIAFSVSTMADKRKGGHYLLEALRNLDLPDVTVLLIGKLDAPFTADVAEVISLGYVTDPSTLTAALSAANVYVGPSTEETFGQVFIEAALVGIPSIGFDQTGVRDAIVEGVTGLRVACSAEALRGAISRLYLNRDLCESLGRWAQIHASNEFSLESSFQSIFAIWRQCGLVDKCELPHKVGFVRLPQTADMRLDAVPLWRGLEGILPVEGPYPQFDVPTTFQWCHSERTRLKVNCTDGGRYQIRLTYYSPLFDLVNVRIRANGETVGSISISRTDPGKSRHIDFVVEAQPGWNYLELMPDRMKPPTDDAPKALTFMLQDVELTHLGASVKEAA